jgi:hypothetical protein
MNTSGLHSALVVRVDTGETRWLGPAGTIDAALGEAVVVRCATGDSSLHGVLRQVLVGFGLLRPDRLLPPTAVPAMLDYLRAFATMLPRVGMRAFVILDHPERLEAGVVEQLCGVCGARREGIPAAMPRTSGKSPGSIEGDGDGVSGSRRSISTLSIGVAACLFLLIALAVQQPARLQQLYEVLTLTASVAEPSGPEATLPEISGFIIAIATFDAAGRADRTAASLRARNMPAFVEQTAKNGRRFRVYVGPYVSSDEASAALRAVRPDFADAWVSPTTAPER